MRRSDKEIKDPKIIESILGKAQTCRVGLCKGNMPYVLPMNFGYENKTLFLHSAKEGKKIDILKKNNNVCFEAEIGTELKASDTACSFGMKYQSVIGYGKAYFVESLEEKKKAIDVLMTKYSPKEKKWEYKTEELEKITVIRVEIESLTGKKSG